MIQSTIKFKNMILSPQVRGDSHMSGFMRKPAFCICDNKGADQLSGSHTLISAFVFTKKIPQSSKISSLTSHLLRLYSLVCVRPGQNA